ncbi:hypothetical protein DFH09DRAFT_1351476 [Mycena vulgaris]|nr:hypothetical protein DFH09DRAFT_1351476 [Mycena vulgaris]
MEVSVSEDVLMKQGGVMLNGNVTLGGGGVGSLLRNDARFRIAETRFQFRCQGLRARQLAAPLAVVKSIFSHSRMRGRSLLRKPDILRERCKHPTFGWGFSYAVPMASLPSTLTRPHTPAPPSRLSLATILYASSSPRTTTLPLRAPRSACAALARPRTGDAPGVHPVRSPLHFGPASDHVRSLDRAPCAFYRPHAPRSACAALARPRTGGAPGVRPVHSSLPYEPASNHVRSLYHTPYAVYRLRAPCSACAALAHPRTGGAAGLP